MILITDTQWGSVTSKHVLVYATQEFYGNKKMCYHLSLLITINIFLLA